MSIFLVVVTEVTRVEQAQAKVLSLYSERHLRVTADSWLIAGNGTAQKLSDNLGITDGSVAPGLVVSVGSYFGRASPTIWEWMIARWEEAASV